ncbi:MAG: hypothetical protein JWM93_2968 [Frankiales bacterium]|nr:hypothetical protein [Frankiales bacterium]
MPPVHPSSSGQPWLHDLNISVNGNVTVLSDRSGDIDGSGAQGVFADDRRVLSRMLVQLGGRPVVAVGHSQSGARATFFGSARHLGDPGADPTVEVHRHRRVVTMGVAERIVVTSRASAVVDTELVVSLGGDGADISVVKSGLAGDALLPAVAGAASLRWADERHEVVVRADGVGASATADAAGGGTVRLRMRLSPGASSELTLTVAATRVRATTMDADAGSAHVDWSQIRAVAQDSALGPTVEASLDDLRHLLLTDPEDPRDVFAAAGTPWYLTLFGRDSLWAARMMLPFGTALAAGTLRALARRQGTTVDARRAEDVGKIPHELRRAGHRDDTTGLALPPAYYGTVDATALWISLLHDAWRWGLPATDVEALLPNLEAALDWMTVRAVDGADGLLKYVDSTGAGLANQGWKDSGDAIRWRDGRVATAPIALVEAQAYAVEAATSAAALLDAFDRRGSERLVEWADVMRQRVRERFWVAHGETGGPWLGMAIDGSGAVVDGLASNMGHVLGTGTLSDEESRQVARTLTSPALLDPYGIRTLASDNAGFNPIGYHTGSIWTHDTAICAWNLSRSGHPAEAAIVTRALLSSAVSFGHHWPELYSGDNRQDAPVPYPASCRPQAWAAASAAVLVTVALGFEPDAPQEKLVLRPSRPGPFGELSVSGLQFAGHSFTAHCATDGTTTVDGLPPHVTVDLT